MPYRNAGALLRHRMIEEQKRFLRAAGRTGDVSGREADESMQMTETRIYVGLNDAQTRKQAYETDRYLDILKDVCRSYHAAFSVDVEDGGYYHEDGEYTEETSLVLVLIDTGRETVQKIAKELCARFHQESVLVTEDRIVGQFLRVSADA